MQARHIKVKKVGTSLGEEKLFYIFQICGTSLEYWNSDGLMMFMNIFNRSVVLKTMP